jgi:hypothetical protein
MPFTKNDPNTKAAAKKGGTTGKKHFSVVPKNKLKEITSKAGKNSGKKRRELRERKKLLANADKIEKDVMTTYYP